MKQTSSRTVRDAFKRIKEAYGFMLERGYEVISTEEYSLGWQVVLRKADLFVQIIRTRGEEFVSIRTSTQSADKYVDIGSVVYAATGENIPRAGDDSKELQRYIDKIEAYFQGDYIQNEDRLRVAQEEYVETRLRVEVVAPKQPEIIPILHYPLMAMIILLILGALFTLYAVLLDRLFSSFSLNTDFYGLCLGTGALLLAMSAVFLLWRGRKKS